MIKLLPEERNLIEHKLFRFAYFGEIAGLCFGALALLLLGQFSGQMLSILLIHALLIWAWGRRYWGVDWIYIGWNIPSLLLLGVLAAGIIWTAVRFKLRLHPVGIQFGDGSISFLGLAAMLTAVASRSVGLFWTLAIRKNIEHRESSPLPLLGLICALAALIFHLFLTGTMLESAFFLSISFYAIGISI